MKIHFRSTELAISLCLALAMSGCGGVSVWPFGGDKTPDRPSRLLNSTQYVCTGGKSFNVRMIDNGSAAWIIFPEREVRFDKDGNSPGTRYRKGAAVLELNGNQATLHDGPTLSFTDCKAAEK